jgi:helicase MOV-10
MVLREPEKLRLSWKVIQVLRYDQSSKILVCAPSDTACDVIASRLLSNLPKKSNGDAHTILRVNWWSRNPASLPPILLSCSPTERMSGLFKMPTAAQIQDSSIIICQCFVAGCLEIGSHTPWMENHFTHVFIDESSQSLEYESLIPLLKVGRKCSIVLSGDPKQLGPTVRSITANQNGLALSLQERLMGLPLYKNHGFCVSTELVDNYRSHEVLLQVSSELFYNGNLRCKAPKEITSVCEGLELLPRADFPLVVYDVEGEEKNKIDTPSFFNIEECYTIVKLIKAVLHSSPDKIHTGQISVITCFRAQVLKMREIFRSNNLASVNIGVVEDFQGQESLVVFISTVLTKDQKRWETGAKRGLGFMTDPKRFNVSITRASALCVIVGNLNFLEKSGTYWTALIEHVRRNNGITGENYEIPDDEKKIDDEEDFGISYFLDCVKSMKLLGVGHEIDRYDMAMRGYFQDSPEWKVCL